MGKAIKKTARAIKCLIQVRGVMRKSPKRSQSCLMVEHPIVAMMNNPTHLQLPAKPKPTPVRQSQTNHSSEKELLR